MCRGIPRRKVSWCLSGLYYQQAISIFINVAPWWLGDRMTLGEFCQVSLGDAQTSTVSGGSKGDGQVVVSGYPWRHDLWEERSLSVSLMALLVPRYFWSRPRFARGVSKPSRTAPRDCAFGHRGPWSSWEVHIQLCCVAIGSSNRG